MTQRPDSGDGLDHGILPDLIGYQLRLAQVALFRDFERTVGDLGISPGRVGVLVLVDANPGLTQSRLAKAVELDRSTLVPVLDDLEQRGLLERRQGTDRRTNGLWLTPLGKKFLARVKRRIVAHEQRLVGGLSAKEREQLVSLLARLRPPAPV
jgi:DNA-binding MarR family transcriptional regulator